MASAVFLAMMRWGGSTSSNEMMWNSTAAAAAPAGGDLVGKLTQLAELNASGTLTDEQFAAAARKELLGQ